MPPKVFLINSNNSLVFCLILNSNLTLKPKICVLLFAKWITKDPSASENPANQWFENKSNFTGGKILILNFKSYLFLTSWSIFLLVKNLPLTKFNTFFNPSECLNTYLTEFFPFNLRTEP